MREGANSRTDALFSFCLTVSTQEGRVGCLWAQDGDASQRCFNRLLAILLLYCNSMRKTLSSFSLHKEYCHPISTENYFLSPKMPIKDHVNAFRSTKVSFRPNRTFIDEKSKGVLEKVDLNYTQNSQALRKSLSALKEMNLFKSKHLHVINHFGADKSLNSNIHTMQTNPGYSRNTLGGIYTK